MHVYMDADEDNQLVLACLDLHPIGVMVISYSFLRDVDIPNWYVDKPGERIVWDIIIPVGELYNKLGVTQENRKLYYYSFDGWVHFNWIYRFMLWIIYYYKECVLISWVCVCVCVLWLRRLCPMYQYNLHYSNKWTQYNAHGHVYMTCASHFYDSHCGYVSNDHSCLLKLQKNVLPKWMIIN